jgi:hypothetical protein
MDNEMVIIHMPRADWEQLVGEYEYFYGMPLRQIEVFQYITVFKEDR